MMIKRKTALKRSTKPIERSPLKRSTKRIERRVRPRPARRTPDGQPSDSYLLGLLTQAVRLRDPICVTCREKPTYDAMHMIGRSARRVRWDLDNVMGGCRECHDKWTRNSKKWGEWWKRRIGSDRTDALLRKSSNMLVKPDPVAAKTRLLSFIKEMKNVRASAVPAAATASAA